jgi:hypothetical protein
VPLPLFPLLCGAVESSSGRCAFFPPGLWLIRIFNRCGGNLSGVSHPLGGSLFGLEQLLHSHAFVDMVLGAREFAGCADITIASRAGCVY